MFMGDYEQDAPWSTDSLKGCKRFLDRIIRLKDKVIEKEEYSDKLVTIIHQSIKKVTHDILNIRYNTVVSTLMILLNKMEELPNITTADYRLLLILLNPMAPHITEELNESLGFEPICNSTWPTYDEEKTIESQKEVGVQINGKLRGSINVNINDTKEIMQEKALANENLKKYIEGKEIVKIIAIPNKIVNIVIK